MNAALELMDQLRTALRERDELRAEAKKLGDALTQETRLSIAMAEQRDEARAELHASNEQMNFIAKALQLEHDDDIEDAVTDMVAEMEHARDRIEELRAEVERLRAATASPIRVVELHDSGQLMPGINAPRCRLRIEADGYAWIPSDGSAESRIGPVEDAYRRGAEAMREACAQRVEGEGNGHYGLTGADVAKTLRALPIPEES